MLSKNPSCPDKNKHPSPAHFPRDRTHVLISFRTFCRVTGNGDLGWQPIAEFKPEANPFITLMLVASQRNFHTEKRLDPIFPANRRRLIGDKFLWMNDDPVATVLACTDRASICTAAGDTCWDASEDPAVELQDPIEKNGLYMLKMALEKSSTCHSLLLRGGAALDASTKLVVYNSLKLAQEQWKVEAQNLFATSLARTQVALRDHMRGSAAKEPGFVNVLPPEFAGVCNRYVFKGVGWTDVRVWGFVVAMVGSTVVFVLAFKVKIPDAEGESDEEQGDSRGRSKKEKLVIEIFITCIKKFPRRVLQGIKVLGRWFRGGWNRVKTWAKAKLAEVKQALYLN